MKAMSAFRNHVARDADASAGARTSASSAIATAEARVARIPAPYRAMLAICSDLDETPDARVYAEICRYLNTDEPTSLGPGVGLEVGNTLYFDMPAGQFAYWNTDEVGRAMARALIRSGHIDCLHSFGDLATSRAHAERALDELEAHDCRLEVWVDHAIAPTNLGADIMQGRGDLPGDGAYHADRTLAHGVRYVWRGRVTSVIAQDTPAGWIGRLDPRATLKTLAKEGAKQALARLGAPKYAPHAQNRVLWPAQLRDGARVWEFLRTNWHPQGVSVGDTGEGIADVLTDRSLDALVRRGGVSILYTHLGKLRDPCAPLSDAVQQAWRRLAQRAQSGEILVTTTRRLLGYVHARDRVCFSTRREGDRIVVSLSAEGLRREDLDGLTFESDAGCLGRIEMEGVELAHSPGGAARLSVPWRKLRFPKW